MRFVDFFATKYNEVGIYSFEKTVISLTLSMCWVSNVNSSRFKPVTVMKLQVNG